MKKLEFLGDALCLDFLNTLHDAGAKDDDPGEELSSDADLAAWAAQAGILSPSEAGRLQAGTRRNYPQNPRLSAKNALGLGTLPGKKHASLPDDARTLREALRQMFQRAAHHGKIAPRDVRTLNRLLERFPAAGRIQRSNGDGECECEWKMNWESRAGGAEKIFYAIVKSAAELVATGRWRAVRECASDTCTWMFLDTSKNHSRRWCEMARCGNRDKVNRFRARSRRARPRQAVRR